eukprot:SAG25_NODE_10131_length_345_cov_0.654472_1_plen_58_part_01
MAAVVAAAAAMVAGVWCDSAHPGHELEALCSVLVALQRGLRLPQPLQCRHRAVDHRLL